MRRNSLKVKAQIYMQDYKYERLIPSKFCRKVIYEAVRVIEKEFGISSLLAEMMEDESIKSRYLRHFQIDMSICGDPDIRRYNALYRGIDSATDVLSFPIWEDRSEFLPQEAVQTEAIKNEEYDECEEESCKGKVCFPAFFGISLTLGQIIVSIDTAARQAKEDEVSLKHMTAWLIAHSMLHLLGFDHPDEEQRRSMMKYEKKILRAAGFSSLPAMAAKIYKD